MTFRHERWIQAQNGHKFRVGDHYRVESPDDIYESVWKHSPNKTPVWGPSVKVFYDSAEQPLGVGTVIDTTTQAKMAPVWTVTRTSTGLVYVKNSENTWLNQFTGMNLPRSDEFIAKVGPEIIYVGEG